MNNLNTSICVIGGGAAGLMAAGTVIKYGGSVTVFEGTDRLGKKLAITGKGRCNVTNNCAIQEFLENVINNPHFMYGALNAFSPADTMELFESLGVELKTERGNRVFPKSDKAIDIVNAMRKYAKDAEFVFEKVVSVTQNVDGNFLVKTKKSARAFDNVIISNSGFANTKDIVKEIHDFARAVKEIERACIFLSVLGFICADGYRERAQRAEIMACTITHRGDKIPRDADFICVFQLGSVIFGNNGFQAILVAFPLSYDQALIFNVEPIGIAMLSALGRHISILFSDGCFVINFNQLCFRRDLFTLHFDRKGGVEGRRKRLVSADVCLLDNVTERRDQNCCKHSDHRDHDNKFHDRKSSFCSFHFVNLL